MSKPYIHSKSSARRFGGVPEDYLDIHEEMDCTKSVIADCRHRAIYHSAFGIYLIQKVFGTTRVNSEGKTYSVRDIGEQHVMEDLGFIPSMQDWYASMKIEDWMMGKRTPTKTTHIPMETV